MRDSARWEVGSEFHWMGLPAPPFLPWPQPAAWYALGRHAVTSLLEMLGKSPSTRLWVPEYFCHDVVEAWRAHSHPVSYRDDPRRQEPDWSSLQPSAGDVVVAMNYFGVRAGAAWPEFRQRSGCLLLEDHSHDPLSAWAAASRADYAFGSLRKTLPVPDGAILWSPRGLPLPTAPPGGESKGSAMKLAAMKAKAEYLSGAGAADLKPQFREWQQEGEASLAGSAVSSISHCSLRYLLPGVPETWRDARAKNVRFLLERLRGWDGATLLFRDWPQGSAPLGLVLVFQSAAERDRCRSRLQQGNVYCPVHWPAPAAAGRDVQDLASRILTVPTDQRYSSEDMEKVASVLLGKSGSR